MTFVRLYAEQEAIVEVELPPDAPIEDLTEAALAALDRTGGAEWETILTETSASNEPIAYQLDLAEQWEREHARTLLRTAQQNGHRS